MRAISLWQPWASAIAQGVKTYETRSWRQGCYRGPLAVHAAKHPLDSVGRQLVRELPNPCVPFGVVVAVCFIDKGLPAREVRENVLTPPRELQWGDFSDGRWVWKIIDVRPLRKPLPWRGAQGFFQIPDDVLNTALAWQ